MARNITRALLTSGTLGRYIDELSVTGLTSNPTIFDHAIRNDDFYDEVIRGKTLAGKTREVLFFELALEDLTQAADLFAPNHAASGGASACASATPQSFHQDTRYPAGIPAIEETIFAGVAVNVTLLFSCEHYIAATEAYMRGIEPRIAAGLDPAVGCVAVVQ